MDKLDTTKLSSIGRLDPWRRITDGHYTDLLIAQALIYGAEWRGDMMSAEITMKSPTGRVLAGHAVLHILSRRIHSYMVHPKNYDEFTRWVNEEHEHE